MIIVICSCFSLSLLRSTNDHISIKFTDHSKLFTDCRIIFTVYSKLFTGCRIKSSDNSRNSTGSRNRSTGWRKIFTGYSNVSTVFRIKVNINYFYSNKYLEFSLIRSISSELRINISSINIIVLSKNIYFSILIPGESSYILFYSMISSTLCI